MISWVWDVPRPIWEKVFGLVGFQASVWLVCRAFGGYDVAAESLVVQLKWEDRWRGCVRRIWKRVRRLRLIHCQTVCGLLSVKELREIELVWCQGVGSLMPCLCGAESLERVYVEHCSVRDERIECLVGLQGLRELELVECELVTGRFVGLLNGLGREIEKN